MQKKKLHFYWISLAFLGLTHCKLPSSSEAANSKKNQTISLFKDNIDFNLDDVKKGKVCGSIKNNKVQFTYHVWPSDIKQLLANELAKFDYIKMAAPLVEGFYLVDFSPDLAKGLTCHNAKTNKYVVFVNTSVILGQRDNSRIDVSSYIADGRPQGIPALESHGDEALQTVFHELFHVIDLGIFFDHLVELTSDKIPKDPEKATVRRKFLESTWKTATESIFENLLSSSSGASLTAEKKQPRNHSNHVSGKLAVVVADHMEIGFDKQTTKDSFGLADPSTIDKIANLQTRVQIIAEKTNFTSNYATDNFLEDFAVTLEQYFLGTRYGMWERMEFFAPVKPYVFTTKDLITRDTAQRKKTCELVRDVFNETCR